MTNNVYPFRKKETKTQNFYLGDRRQYWWNAAADKSQISVNPFFFLPPALFTGYWPQREKKEEEIKAATKISSTVSVNQNHRRQLLIEERETFGRLDCFFSDKVNKKKFVRKFLSCSVVVLWAVSCARPEGREWRQQHASEWTKGARELSHRLHTCAGGHAGLIIIHSFMLN